MWEGLYGDTAAITYFPELLAEEAAVTAKDDGGVTISFRLREGLTWSDGMPLTANDVKFFQDLIMEEGPPDEEGNPTFASSLWA